MDPRVFVVLATHLTYSVLIYPGSGGICSQHGR
jgi:hypothetical protein